MATKEACRLYYIKNRERLIARARTRYFRIKDESPEMLSEQYKGYKLKHRYGISKDDVEKMLESQEGKCPVCLRDLNSRSHIDHCHDTGKVRAVLCPDCNHAEGLIRSPEVAMRLFNYMFANLVEKYD